MDLDLFSRYMDCDKIKYVKNTFGIVIRNILSKVVCRVWG